MNYWITNEAGDLIPADMMTWAQWHEVQGKAPDMGLLRIALTRINIDVRVSTVFLGINHNFNPAGVPLLYESMTFGGPLDGEMERYATKEQALAGHAAMVAMVEKEMALPKPEHVIGGEG